MLGAVAAPATPMSPSRLHSGLNRATLLIRPYRLLPSNISAPLSPQLFSYAEQEVARLELPQARARYRLFRNVFYYFLELNMELDGPQAQWRLGFRLPKVVTRAPVVPVGI